MPTSRGTGCHVRSPRPDYAGFCAGLPKAELHVHIEGTLTPRQRMALAQRNRLDCASWTLGEIEAARNFGGTGTPQGDLKAMLDYYYQGLQVLHAESDFFGIVYDYLRGCHEENIRHAEISFDPQAHTTRGIAFESVMEGLRHGAQAAEAAFGVRSTFILCINRDKSVDSAFDALRAAQPYREYIAGIGLDSLEEGNPPIKFAPVFAEARAQGYRLTAHCDVDQQDSVKHIWQCLDVLGVDRIDHGINCIEDASLVAELVARKTCLTACPTWRPRDPGPRRVDRIRTMLDAGLRVTLNSDDPGVLSSGTLGHLLPYAAQAGRFTAAEIARFAANAFEGAWIDPQRQQEYLAEVAAYVAHHADPILGPEAGSESHAARSIPV